VVASLLAVLVLSQIHAPAAGPTNPMYLAGLMLTLAVTGIMCILQTRLQQQAREELSRVSRVDPLTGALNRRDGHAAGDELLRWAVSVMRATLRPEDGLGRLGGDEFAALLAGIGRQEAEQVADRLRLALSLRVSACTGTAATDVDGAIPEVLHRCADKRLYASKRTWAASLAGAAHAG
jgi:GGDEF domain-containing protein